MSLTSNARALADRVHRRLWPTPDEAAGRALRKRTLRLAHGTAGVMKIQDLEIEFVDSLSLDPQWQDFFVRRSLAFTSEVDTPRVLDCGANIGLAAVWLKRAYPRARVTAFEADPHICDVLRRNLARNGLSDVEVVHGAIWSDNIPVAFRAQGAEGGAVDVVGADTVGPLIEVPAIRLRDVLARERVDFLKLDIEGAELDVLEDAEATLENVRAIHLEVHDFNVSRRVLPRCLLALERAGFTYAVGEVTPATWRRDQPRGDGPFPLAVPVWVATVRAWR
jgi:FkbM family methyltransferase